MSPAAILAALDALPLAEASKAALRAFVAALARSELVRLLESVRAVLRPGTRESFAAADRVIANAARALSVELSPLQVRLVREHVRSMK